MESHREKKVDKKPHQEDGPRRKRVKQAGGAFHEKKHETKEEKKEEKVEEERR